MFHELAFIPEQNCFQERYLGVDTRLLHELFTAQKKWALAVQTVSVAVWDSSTNWVLCFLILDIGEGAVYDFHGCNTTGFAAEKNSISPDVLENFWLGQKILTWRAPRWAEYPNGVLRQVTSWKDLITYIQQKFMIGTDLTTCVANKWFFDLSAFQKRNRLPEIRNGWSYTLHSSGKCPLLKLCPGIPWFIRFLGMFLSDEPANVFLHLSTERQNTVLQPCSLSQLYIAFGHSPAL